MLSHVVPIIGTNANPSHRRIYPPQSKQNFNAGTGYHLPISTPYCLRRLVSLGPISGLALLLISGRGPTPIEPIAGKSGPGLEYPLPMGIDIVYAGVLYGLTPVVISATLGSICPPCPPLPIPIAVPPPIAANANPSLGLGGGTDLGVLSLLAAIVLPALIPLPLELLCECDVVGLL
jgi:hypothetical protein